MTGGERAIAEGAAAAGVALFDAIQGRLVGAAGIAELRATLVATYGTDVEAIAFSTATTYFAASPRGRYFAECERLAR